MASTITLNGRIYAVDYGSEAYQRQSIPLLRRQSDSSDRPGAQSINPEGPWRRAFESWHHGEGQSHADREDSDPYRFDTSEGIDCWEKYRLQILSTTNRYLAPTTGITYSLVVGERLYVVDGADVKFAVSSAPTVWTTVTGLAGTPGRLASDGATVYIPVGGSLYSMSNSGSAASSYNASPADGAAYVKGRLITYDDMTLNNVVDGATTTELLEIPAGKWVDVTEGSNFIYAAASTQSAPNLAGTGEGVIYRIGIKADGTGLDVPIVAAKLPTGEDVFSIFGYLGYLLIGTSKGIRFAAENSDGSLTLGALRAVQVFAEANGAAAFTAEDRFIYAAQSATDGTKAGLTRLDLTSFIAPLTPAAAADLTVLAGYSSALSPTTVTSCGIWAGQRYFIVSGSTPGTPDAGVWMAASLGTIGYLTSGVIDYGITESKIPLHVDIQTEPLTAGTSVAIAVAVDGGSFTTVGTHDADGATSFTADLASLSASNECRSFQIKLTLNSSAGISPIITRCTLRTYPVAERGEIVQLPLIMAEGVDHDGLTVWTDVSAETALLRNLLASKQLVTLVEGDTTSQVYVEDFAFRIDAREEDGTDPRGVLLVKLKSFG